MFQSIKDIGNADPDVNNEDKLITLRDHLLSLSKAEGQIEKIKDKTLESSQTTRTETSVIEILELWQQVFRETFQQYHRLSTRLVKNEDSAAALKLWQEYLVHVQQFLAGTIPDDYHGLSEHQHLCQLHQNLLTTQQNVLKPLDAKEKVELSVMEQFNSLTNLHNETLSRIMERHNEVQNRLDAWDKYRQDQNKLLAWLKDMEKERERLQLRYIHMRRVPKVLSRIGNLLSKIPQGEEKANQLQKQQNHLLQFCDEALATSIRMEHAAITQRISNLQAGLETWRQFLERIQELIKSYENGVQVVQQMFENVQEIVTANAADIPTTHAGISGRLENLHRARTRLAGLTKDLEQLGITQEQLKECVSPSDMKTVNQRMWLLWHQQSDLDHQLAILCHQLEEKLGVRSMFEARQSRFITWSKELEKRLEQDDVLSTTEIKDPEEILRKLETELEAEMSLKEREYKWLINTGKELVASCGDEYSDVVAKQNIQTRTNEVLERWQYLQNLGKTRTDKINAMIQTMTTLEQRIAEIRAWLTQIEAQLSKPVIFKDASKPTIDEQLQEHDVLKKSIEKESGNIGEVLNLCELLLSDADLWKTYFTTENITTAVQNLEKRWKNVCGVSAERKRKISFAWKLLQEVLKLSNEHEKWLKEQEVIISKFEVPLPKHSKEQIRERISALENEINEIEAHGPEFEILEHTYSKLAKTSSLDPQNIQELTSKAKDVILRWHALKPRAIDALQKLKHELSLIEDFENAHGDAVMSLTKVDAQLTELQHLTEAEAPEKRLGQLENVERILTAQNATLENADKLGLLIMKKSDKQEVVQIQQMIDEYQLLWKDIQERIITLKSDLQEQVKLQTGRLREVDESVQVETLKFEEDTAVQVNTLHPKLQRMTSISAKDAYLVELSTALQECRSNLDKLEDLVSKEIPQQGSPELHTSAKKIAKLSGSCQSNIELVQHLHDLLINECSATAEEVRTEEVDLLVKRFEELIGKAKNKEQKIRELR